MTKSFVYILSGILMLTFMNADAVNNRQCIPCTSVDYPICATNGTHYFLFKNECRLKTENTKRGKTGATKLEKTEIANCFQRCDQICTDEYAPICAITAMVQRTFQNRCQLDLENCRSGNIWMILHEGECPSTQLPPTMPHDPVCPAFCPLYYAPVCASFGGIDQTFQNLCYLQVDSCVSKRAWKLKNEGECIDPQPQCNEACPKIYSPLCASFNGENRTFSNECLLEAEICLTGNQWTILYRGECVNPTPTCSTACPEVYDPVCASNNGEQRTFPNRCFADIESSQSGQVWNIEYSGECKEPPCSQVCPFIFRPICATFNGVTRTFANQCFLESEMCKTGEDWVVISEDACEPTTTSQPMTTTTTPIPPVEPQTNASPTTPPFNCPDACTMIYEPICAGFQGSERTFSNGCEMTAETCRTGINWQVLYDGPCDEQIDDANPPVPTVCPAIYDPVCATLDGQFRTFPSQCVMNAEIANTNQEWQFVDRGECPPPTTTDAPVGPIGPIEPIGPIGPIGPCPRCSDFYQPVCGFSDGEQRTFTNECQLFSENCYSGRRWVIVYGGECKASDVPRSCPNICPLNYDPVCGIFNGVKRTFPNECELNHEAYRTNIPWVILNVGACDYCPVCSNFSDPVCAEFNGQVQTFDNACKMEYENCKNRCAWQIVSRNTCDCPTFCPRILRPICATNNGENRTFNSICEMKMEACKTNTAWTMVSEFACPPPPPINCPTRCPLYYDPVCGTNQGESRTFGNECFLRAEICRTGINWVLCNSGPCPEPTKTPPETPQPGVELAMNPKMLTAFTNYLRSSNANSKPSEGIDPTIDPMPQPQPPEADSLADSIHLPPKPFPPPPCQINQCMAIYDPVCAFCAGEMRTFSNICYLDNYNRRTGENWRIMNNGPCQAPVQRCDETLTGQ